VADDGIAKGVRAAEALCGAPAISAFGGCEVTSLIVEGGRVAGVETAMGTIRAEHVVVAAGIWGRQAAKLAPGLNIPLEPVEHQLAYTAPLPELAGETREVVHPILRHQDHAMYFRQVADGYAIGNYRHEPRLADPERPAELPFTPDDFAAAHAEAGRLLPALRDVELTRAFNGLMSFTPDGFPLLGRSAAARNLWLAQAIWVTHSGGCGRALAELMTHGDALLDLHECDPQRFDAHGTSRTYTRARGAQGYREVYDVIHPRQQSEHARGLRTTPFYERQERLGARPGSGRSGTRATATCSPATRSSRTTSGRRGTGRRSSRPSTAPAASAPASSTSPRSRRSRSPGPARRPSCSAWPPTTSARRSARSSTPRCSRRARGSCAT
jgi:dimethylglycine oxidase